MFQLILNPSLLISNISLQQGIGNKLFVDG
jgi:hypothetical protein